MTELATYTVEERREDGEAILRRSVKGATVDALREAASAAGGDGGAAAGGDGAAPAWAEDEQICEDEPGLVFFDGGTFSRGPARLLAAGDAALAAAAAAQRAALERQIGLPLVGTRLSERRLAHPLERRLRLSWEGSRCAVPTGAHAWALGMHARPSWQVQERMTHERRAGRAAPTGCCSLRGPSLPARRPAPGAAARCTDRCGALFPQESSTGIVGEAGAVGLPPEEHSVAGEGWEPGADAGPGVGADDGNGDPEGERIAAEADVGKPPERQTVVVEQCCAWGGEQRLRLRLTLCVGAGVRTAHRQVAGAVACMPCEPDPWRPPPAACHVSVLGNCVAPGSAPGCMSEAACVLHAVAAHALRPAVPPAACPHPHTVQAARGHARRHACGRRR